MAEKTNVPEIRFAGFTDPWEQRKFSDMYVVNNERNANCELGYDRTLSIATMTFNGGNGAADDSLSNYKVIRIGDIAFEGHTNKVHAYGRFVLNDAGDGLMSPRFSCLRPIVEQRYSFWKYYIPREESMRPILVNATKSGTMMNELVPDDLMRESILVPCLAEQEIIGNSLSQLDHLITLHQRKYDKLAQLKKSMLDKMFPKPGERFPEIRFAGFTDPWEQRKLGELCTISKGHGYSKADIRDAGTPLILYGRLYTQYESRIENVDTFAVEQEGSLLSKGNEVIVPASGETAEDIAVASSVCRSGIIFGGDLNVVTPVSKLDPDYIALAITYSKAHDDLARRAQGKSVVHVHGNDIAEVEIPYPSESEQKRISTVVLGLDSLITLHQRKLELLRNTKKSLLDRMFV